MSPIADFYRNPRRIECMLRRLWIVKPPTLECHSTNRGENKHVEAIYGLRRNAIDTRSMFFSAVICNHPFRKKRRKHSWIT